MLKRLFASRKTPYIPGLHTPEKIQVDLSGNTLELLLPPHHDYEGFEASQAPISNVNIYDPGLYSDPDKKETIGFSRAFINRRWEYYGPFWRGKPIGSTTFVATVDRVNKFPEGMTCFNPNHLEQGLIHLMYMMGPFKPQYGKREAPLNWCVAKKQDSIWFQYSVSDTYENLAKEHESMRSYYSSYIVTALDDIHYLRLMFHNMGYVPVVEAIRNMNALRDKVFKNLHLNLGVSSSQQLDAAKQRWPSAKASEHRSPESWVYPEWRSGDRSKNEPDIVILKAGSSPPPFTP